MRCGTPVSVVHISLRRRRELALSHLRVAYMSLTKNTILVRSRLLYVYHRRPAHRRRGFVALNVHRYYLHFRPAARFSRKIKGERGRETEKGDTIYKLRARDEYETGTTEIRFDGPRTKTPPL